MTLLPSMAAALAMTLILELVFALVWGIRDWRLWLIVLMNLLTNPAVNLLHALAARLLGWSGFLPVLLLEAAAVCAEALCCRGAVRRHWLFAVLINLFSYSAGALIQQLL